MWKIYLATCTENGKVYVGQTAGRLSKRRWTHENRKDYDAFFQRALRKHGLKAFTWEIIGTADSKKQADNLERLWIILLQSKNRIYGYNLTAGGLGSFGCKKSEESRRKLSASLHRANVEGRFIHAKGYKWPRGHSEETKKKLSIAIKALPKKEKITCCVSGCNKFNHAKGYCAPHFHRLKRYGDPLKGRPFGSKGPEKGKPYGPRTSSRSSCKQINLW